MIILFKKYIYDWLYLYVDIIIYINKKIDTKYSH